MKHTPTPWEIKKLHGNYEGYVLLRNTGDGLRRIDFDKDGTFKEDDAAFIVRAVNSHEELLEALKGLVAYALDCRIGGAPVVEEARQAIAKAEQSSNSHSGEGK